MTRASVLIDEARSWVGTPFLHQGRSRLGVDCVGFVTCVLGACALLPERADRERNYPRLPNGNLEAALEAHAARIPVALAGCLLLLRWPREPHARHLALCTGPTLIHAYELAGGVVEQGYREPWLRLTASRWRVAGVL